MGRAIDMENDITELKAQVKKLEDIVRGMTHTMEGLSTTEHIDLVDDVKVEEDSDGKKANNKTSSKSSGRDKKSNGSSKNKNNKSTTCSLYCS